MKTLVGLQVVMMLSRTAHILELDISLHGTGDYRSPYGRGNGYGMWHA